MSHLKRVFIAGLCVAFIVGKTAFAATVDVWDVESFSNAVTAAQANGEDDIIVMGPGTYFMEAPVVFNSVESNSLTITAAGGKAVLDTRSYSRMMYIWQKANSANAWVAISNIVFKNGFANADYAGAVWVRTQRGDLTFDRCTFQNCRSTAMYVSSQAGAVFARIENSGTISFLNGIVSTNRAKGIGGGLYFKGGSGVGVTIRNSLFRDNDGSTSGGAVQIETMDGVVSVENNTFYNNLSGNGNGGGGLYLSMWGESGSADIRNNIFRTNTCQSGLGEDLYLEDDADGNGTGATITLLRNAYAYMDRTDGDHLTLVSNTTADPQLRPDMLLKSASPCFNTGTNSPWMTGTTDLAGLPRINHDVVDMGAYELEYTNRRPKLVWTEVAGASQYEVWLTRNGSKYYDAWQKKTNTSWTAASDLKGGDYEWWVRSWSAAAGNGEWSRGNCFAVATQVPGQPTLVGPSGPVATNRPFFSWNPDANRYSSTYNFYLTVGGNKYTNIWVSATNYTPPSALPFGSFVWWLRGASADGNGPWAASMAFTHGTPVALYPTGTVTVTRTPVFSWTEVPGATWYRLWIKKGSGTYTQCWVQATNWTSPNGLTGTNYQWWVQAYNSRGTGPWSARADFSIPRAIPAVITLVSPTGNSAGATQNYTWQSDPAATQYQLLVKKGTTSWYTKWYSTGITGGNIVKAVSGHTAGQTYNWSVRGYTPDGTGPWSAFMSFTN